MATMHLVLLLLAAVLVSAVIDQIVPKISSPLIQIGLGVVIALLSISPIDISWDSNLFLLLFIAPLLYDEARSADLKSLWENKRSVLSLAIGLVVTSTVVIGFAVNLTIPAIPLLAAFALGAALGPTDAVAVSSLPEDVNIGQRRRSILKGESLINDASGIVCFTYALQYAMSGDFSAGLAVLTFLFEFFGGILLGVILGWLIDFITGWVASLGLENSTFHVLYDLFVPFMVYLVAEAFNVSGVLSVVAAGLYLSATSRRVIGPRASRLNIVSANVWRVFTFALNGIVFVLLGTQLPKAMRTSWENVNMSNTELVVFSLVLTILVVLVRFIWVYAMECDTHRKEGIRFLSSEMLRSVSIMTFGGPKGAITLSIMLTIPTVMSTGEAFPQRDLIIFLACCVIVGTLLLSCFAVPLFADARNVSDEEEKRRTREAKAKIEILRRVIEELTARQTSSNRRATQSVIHQCNQRIARIKDAADIDNEINIDLRLKATGWEKDYVRARKRAGDIDEMVALDVLETLERQEDLLQHNARAWRAHIHLRRPIVALRTKWRNARKRIPGLSVSEYSEQKRQVRIGSIESAMHRLREEVAEDTFPTEDVAAVIYEYQHVLSSLRNKRSNTGITGFARAQSIAEEIKREAYFIELEAIQEMYEEGQISRNTARRLRANVSLMQLDIDNKI